MQFTSPVRKNSMIQITFFRSFRGTSAKQQMQPGLSHYCLLSTSADKKENGFAFFPAVILIRIDTRLFI